MTVNLERLDEYPLVAVDVETTGIHWYRDKLFGVAIAAMREDGLIRSGYWDVRENGRILDVLRDKLPRVKKLVNHSIKFDTHFLLNGGVGVPLDRIECTNVRAALINEHEPSFSLDSLSKKYVGSGKVDVYGDLAEMFGGKPTREVQMKNLHRAPSKLVAKYAAEDPVLAIKLYLWQQKEIEKQGINRILDLETRLTPVLIEIERQGVRVDEQLAHDSQKLVDKRVADAQKRLNDLAGWEVNANSAPQMRRLFGTQKTDTADGRAEWRTSSGFLLENTDGGEASIGKDSLRVMAQTDPRAECILMIRRMVKAKSFLKDHVLGHAVRGRVFPNYNQTKSESGLGTGTGRFSIDDPALQQIPMHDIDVASIVRPCFLPEDGEEWGCADWKQFEFRWFAHYVRDTGINRMYEENPDADFHQTVADLTGITRDRKFAGDTANAKQINLGLVFGMGEGEMAYNMGMDYTLRVDKNGREWKTAGDKAKAVFAKYHDAIPGVKRLLNQASSIARARGYVETAMGRRIRFPGGKATYKAGGLVFQGTSADCMKVKMLELWPVCKANRWTMLLTVHDELDFSIPKKQVKSAEPVIRRHLETFDGERCPVKCRIPIRSDISFGINWWEACK